jgi:hypothetical protein
MYRMLIGSGKGVGVGVRVIVDVRLGVNVLVGVSVGGWMDGVDVGAGGAIGAGLQPTRKVSEITTKIKCFMFILRRCFF